MLQFVEFFCTKYFVFFNGESWFWDHFQTFGGGGLGPRAKAGLVCSSALDKSLYPFMKC